MMIGRLVAWVLLLAALIVLCRDLIGWYDTGRYVPIALGALWASLAPGSAAATQAAVEGHVASWLWHPAAAALAVPGWAALAVLALVLLFLFRRREPRSGRARRRRGWR
jgi:hypothetical protein